MISQSQTPLTFLNLIVIVPLWLWSFDSIVIVWSFISLVFIFLRSSAFFRIDERLKIFRPFYSVDRMFRRGLNSLIYIIFNPFSYRLVIGNSLFIIYYGLFSHISGLFIWRVFSRFFLKSVKQREIIPFSYFRILLTCKFLPFFVDFRRLSLAVYVTSVLLLLTYFWNILL